MRCTKINYEYKNTIDKESEILKHDFNLQHKNNLKIIENKNDEIQKINYKLSESQRTIADQRNCQINSIERENDCKSLIKEKDERIKEKDDSFV